jgi:hypothetical protein
VLFQDGFGVRIGWDCDFGFHGVFH